MSAGKILMIRPANFGFNTETAASNSFQQTIPIENAQSKALREFDAMVDLLQSENIELIIINDTPVPAKPDAVFPNNWFCTFPDKSMGVFSMANPSRRIEKRNDIIQYLLSDENYTLLFDYSDEELKGNYLEGTGSLVFDHENKVCFATISIRTNEELIKNLCTQINYLPVLFQAKDKNGAAIYHTNVVMCMGNDFCVVCMDCISEKEKVLSALKKCNKEIIDITYSEMEHFAGNMLFLNNKQGENILVISDTARQHLRKEILQILGNKARLIFPKIPTIEALGGGSVRCMMAELY